MPVTRVKNHMKISNLLPERPRAARASLCCHRRLLKIFTPMIINAAGSRNMGRNNAHCTHIASRLNSP